eukprot:TRINITY_DN916_c0_g1_i4.p1 TRINITY_DN916_c0_g1~~TRINITY_DN916_c0_g1_i4.p1  ORF type:complete len:111 (+),score=8.98 TRINITY_DN916_c0_g1_i4:211-543(+)
MLLHGHLSRDVKITCCASSEGGWGHSKQEFMKKKKQGKLPKDARQKLLDWWNHHYKWPNPSVSHILFFIVDSCKDFKLMFWVEFYKCVGLLVNLLLYSIGLWFYVCIQCT